jgi:hypothetical protein
MDENEYLQRFRLAILWDEFRRTDYPAIKLRSKAVSDWFITLWDQAEQVQHFIGYYFQGYYFDAHGVTAFVIKIWNLRTNTAQIRNPLIRGYYEELLFVADEVLAEIRRSL